MTTDKVFIYGLVDPRNNLIFYVGSAVNVRTRLSQHRTSSFTGRALKTMITEIESAGLKVQTRILEETSPQDRDGRESYWISRCRADGHPLTNKGVPANSRQMAGRGDWKYKPLPRFG